MCLLLNLLFYSLTYFSAVLHTDNYSEQMYVFHAFSEISSEGCTFFIAQGLKQYQVHGQPYKLLASRHWLREIFFSPHHIVFQSQFLSFKEKLHGAFFCKQAMQYLMESLT